MPSTNAVIGAFELVYPPVSNREAEELRKDPDVEAELRRSDFYMIAARAEAKFVQPWRCVGGLIYEVDIVTGSGLSDCIVIDFEKLIEHNPGQGPTISVDLGEKSIHVYNGSDAEIAAGTAELVEWFTTEKIIRDRGLNRPGISGFDKYREFATYDLLYVGIATGQDTFQRLFKEGHRARQRALSSEYSRSPGSLPADEIYLFAYRVSPTILRDLNARNDFKPLYGEELVGHKNRIVKDAEKAFISFLKPQYNGTLYEQYPKGSDGLYGQGYVGYMFVLAENLTIKTPNGTVRGSLRSRSQDYDDADLLSVRGDDFTVLRAK